MTEPSTGRTNANGPFTRANGILVQQAGTFLNGPDRDKGPSDLALDHVFQVNGLVELPWQFQVSGIFRAQSGFHFSRLPATGVLADPDGDGAINGIDVAAGRNAFTAPAFVNLDMRFAKRFNIGGRVKAQVLFEFFNLFNRQNPAAVGRRRMSSSLSASRHRSCPDAKGSSDSDSSSNVGENLHLERVELREIELPLKAPFETSFGRTTRRRILLVKVFDRRGMAGYGECVAMEHPFYNHETIDTAWLMTTK